MIGLLHALADTRRGGTWRSSSDVGGHQTALWREHYVEYAFLGSRDEFKRLLVALQPLNLPGDAVCITLF